MEYAQFVETVGKIDSPNNVDEVYGSLMSNEANTLRIIERVAADTRRDTISSNDIWNMSIKRVLDEFITFWISSYVHVMKQENDILVQKLRSPTGMFHVGLTMFIILTVILVLT